MNDSKNKPAKVEADAKKTVRAVAPEAFSLNFTFDHGNNFSAASKLLWSRIGTRFYRWPGGSDGDSYDFLLAPDGRHQSTPDFANLVQSQGADAYIIVNYGSGSPQMAAAFVAFLNALPGDKTVLGVGKRPVNGGHAWEGGKDWKDFDFKTAGYWASIRASAPLREDDGLNHLRVNHPKPWGFKYFEVGNEVMAMWENDTRPVGKKQDPLDYAEFSFQAARLIKKVDPKAQVGMVVISSEDVTWRDEKSAPYHPVINPVTKKKHGGWNALLLSALRSKGWAPDFIIDHNYPQPDGQENDARLLSFNGPGKDQRDYNGSLSWAGRAKDYRRMLNDYLGQKMAAGVKIINTEHNSVSSNPGKQSTSLVNGLFYADSFGSILQTEILGFCWWLARSSACTGTLLKTLYGWRQYGDYGLVGEDGYIEGGEGKRAGRDAYTPYPTYFAARLAALFAADGDQVISVKSSQPLLAAYATMKKDGRLGLLVVNKSPEEVFTTGFSLKGFKPRGKGKVYSYGKGQDQDQSRGKAVDLGVEEFRLSGPAFERAIPPYSMNVFLLDPA